MTDLTFQDPKGLVNRAAFNARFSVLNELYRYWWKRIGVNGSIRKSDITAPVIIGDKSAGVSISYGTDLRIKSDGSAEIVDPIEYKITLVSSGGAQEAAETLASFAPCYLRGLTGDTGNIYYLPNGTTYGKEFDLPLQTISYQTSNVSLQVDGVSVKAQKVSINKEIYVMHVAGETAVVLCTANTPGSVSYSDEISFNEDTGVVSLISPQTATVSYAGETDSGIAFLRGKYFKVSGKFYYAKDTANYYVDRYQPNAPYGIYAGGLLVEQVKVDAAEYVLSDNRDTYPDSGIENGYEYQYLGIPFENAREASKIVTGSYTGTGQYGSANPNSLTFDFEPKIVFILTDGNSGMAIMKNMKSPSYWGTSTHTMGYLCKSTLIGKTVSWYTTDTDSSRADLSQGNDRDNTYYYIAIA